VLTAEGYNNYLLVCPASALPTATLPRFLPQGGDGDDEMTVRRAAAATTR